MCLPTNYLTFHSSSLACVVCFLFVARPSSHFFPLSHSLILAHSLSLFLSLTHTYVSLSCSFVRTFFSLTSLALFHMYDCTHACLTYFATYIPFGFDLVFSLYRFWPSRNSGHRREIVIVFYTASRTELHYTRARTAFP